MRKKFAWMLFLSCLGWCPHLVFAVNPSVAAGGNFSVALKADGSLWVWGAIAGPGAGKSPFQIGTGFSAIAAGDTHALALKPDGSLWAWGDNYYGQFGDGSDVKSSATPRLVGGGYSAIAAGGGYSLGLKTDGSLWAWGKNENGQLGLGSGSPSTVPTPKLVGNGFSAIAAGYQHAIALKPDGSLWAWGSNRDGQLGLYKVSSLSVPTKSEMVGAGSVVKIAAGQNYSLAINSIGYLFSWGNNQAGQLGNGDLTVQLGSSGTTAASYIPSLVFVSRLPLIFAEISAGQDLHAVAIKTDGSLWAWGNNSNGQIGDGSIQNRYTPVEIGNGYSSVAAGNGHTIAMKSDGSWWAWGDNTNGQVGDPATYKLNGSNVKPTQIAPSGFSKSSANDCLFNWLEDRYPSYISPSRQDGTTSSPYYYRYYPTTKSYVGISSADQHLYFLSASTGLVDLGLMDTWVTQAGCN